MKKHLPFVLLVLALGAIGRFAFPPIALDAQINVANNAANLAGKTLLAAENSNTVSGLLTFSRSGATPFSIAAGSATVPNLLNWSSITITTTGTQNNFAPGLVGNTIVLCNNTALLTITGLGAGIDGQFAYFISKNTGEIDFTNADAGSTAANQLLNYVTSGPTRIVQGATSAGHALYTYSGAASRWVLVEHEQGKPITPTFAAGDFSGTGTLTWTVASGNVNTMQYYLQGKLLRVLMSVTLTSTGGVASTLLQVGNPQWGGYLALTRLVRVGARTVDAGTGTAGYLTIDNTANTKILIARDSAVANWSNAGAANTSVEGEIFFEVQD